MTSTAAPVSASERILTLDLIRGFALLGIFIMNMPYFNTSFFAGADGSHLWPTWWDRGTETVREVIFSGKFNGMFSMLFAVGFAIQLERLEQRDPARAKSIYLRRIFWLFVFGALHTCLFWPGDILHVYAILGLMLLALRRVPEKVLWMLFAACLVYPTAIGIWRVLTITPEETARLTALMQHWEASNNAAFGQGSFLAAARESSAETLFFYTDKDALIGNTSSYVMLASTMLIGLILGRRHFFQTAASQLPLVRRVQWWALGTGLATGIVFGINLVLDKNPMEPTPFDVLGGLCYRFARLCIMAFYVATIVRAAHNDTWRRRLLPIATAGRLPLTNYLMQTLIATFLFQGWGLGLWGKIGPALDLVLAVAIFFLIQVPFSRFWLRHHRLGPAEWLWRRLSYGPVVQEQPRVATSGT
jgi:uncharacterized protein